MKENFDNLDMGQILSIPRIIFTGNISQFVWRQHSKRHWYEVWIPSPQLKTDSGDWEKGVWEDIIYIYVLYNYAKPKLAS